MKGFLVAPDRRNIAEFLFQVSEHLEEGHPRLNFRRRSPITEAGPQDALASGQAAINLIGGLQGGGEAGALPGVSEGAGVKDGLDESP